MRRYIGGHSDIVAGSVTSRSGEIMHEVAKVQKLLGAALAPLESFLLARGLRTLHVRMERHGENAMHVAKMLEGHPLIKQVHTSLSIIPCPSILSPSLVLTRCAHFPPRADILPGAALASRPRAREEGLHIWRARVQLAPAADVWRHACLHRRG